jgi:hypothetical protein
MLEKKVMRGQGPMTAVGTPEDAAAVNDMGNTRMGMAQEQDLLE